MSSVTQVRNGVFYVMVGALLVLMIANVVGGAILLDIRHDQNTTTANLIIGCERANRTRNMQHWLATNEQPPPPAELLAGLTLNENELIVRPRTRKPRRQSEPSRQQVA
jgi:hypothetical protein